MHLETAYYRIHQKSSTSTVKLLSAGKDGEYMFQHYFLSPYLWDEYGQMGFGIQPSLPQECLHRHQRSLTEVTTRSCNIHTVIHATVPPTVPLPWLPYSRLLSITSFTLLSTPPPSIESCGSASSPTLQQGHFVFHQILNSLRIRQKPMRDRARLQQQQQILTWGRPVRVCWVTDRTRSLPISLHPIRARRTGPGIWRTSVRKCKM